MKITSLVIAILTFFCLSSCRNGIVGNKEKELVMVTIEPIRYFAEEIGGDLFTFESQIPKGANPETFDLTPRQIVSLSKSVAYLRIGYIGFEKAWMERLSESNKDMQVFNLSEGLDLIRAKSGGIDPHIWNSTVNARIIARNILKALEEIDSGHHEELERRYEVLLEKIESTENSIRTQLEKNTERSFLIYHPTLTYFARDWELEQICIEEDGKEPSIQQLRQITDESRQKGVRTIFIQPEFDHENARLVAEETGCELFEIYPLSYEWDKEMRHIAEILSMN